ncbi:MAG: hypothetical protein C5B54_01695, partial [Acidobacteria bacterium]
PVEERDALQQNLQLIGITPVASMSSSVGVVIRPTRMTASSTSVPQDEQSQKEAKRFGFLLTRLGKRLAGVTANLQSVPATSGVAASAKTQDVITETLADAARNVKEAAELKRVLEHFKLLGVSAGSDDLFRALGRSLPGWSIPVTAGVQFPENSNLQAMHRIISKTPDHAEAANHFRHLVKSAVERFNEGALPQSASMFDLATKIIAVKEVDEKAIELVLTKGHENLDEEKLRKAADSPDQHHLLRKVLNFFPALEVPGLMDALYDCPKRERRKLLLLLLESHGDPTRAKCLEILKRPLNRDASELEVWYRRNSIHLLRRIPMPPNEPLEPSVDALLPYIDLNLLPVIIKETLAYLPQLRHEKVEQAMKRMLPRLETMLLQPQTAPYEAKEIQSIADRVVSSLCRLGTVSAREAVLDHAIRKKVDNEALVRLGEFASSDLSDDPESLRRLLDALQQTMPLKRLGIVQRQKDFVAKWIAIALSGTLHPEAQTALRDLAQRYPECESGKAVSEALLKQQKAKTAKRTDAPSPTASLMGDLEVFGLPNLLQSLADSALTGTLSIKNSKGESYASLVLVRGKLRECRNGLLTSDEAFYQLFERPQPSTFQFVKALEASKGSDAGLSEILSLMLEGLRRYDEVQQMRAALPDDARLKTKASKPSTLEDEKDGLLFRDLWIAVQNGATPAQCESAVAHDAYRVRRLLAHWSEGGIIEAN